MARHINRLSARTVSTAREQGYIADGGGLYLQISRFGTKSWIFRFMLNKREREMGLGAVNTVSLADARLEAEQCRKLLRKGIDPIEDRKADIAQKKIEQAKTTTFKQAAERHIANKALGWRNIKHADQWTTTLETYAYPVIGSLPSQKVDVGLMLKIIEPIWATKNETANRVRTRIEAVLNDCAARGERTGENPARWRGHLENLLPPRKKVHKVQHFPALPFGQVSAFIANLREQEGTAARGLEFLILTAARTTEVLGAIWKEINLNDAVWTVPAGRIKGEKEHRVPLPSRAIEILQQFGPREPDEFVFPGWKAGRSLSNNAFLALLDRMGHGDITAHGFRSTFRDWVSERTNYPNEVAEMALSHTVDDKTERAYRRGDLFEKRRKMMDDWATFCVTIPAGDNVVTFPAGRAP